MSNIPNEKSSSISTVNCSSLLMSWNFKKHHQMQKWSYWMTKSRHRKNCVSVKLKKIKELAFLSRGAKWQQSSLNIQFPVVQVTLLQEMKHVGAAEISVKNKRSYHKVHISMASKLPISSVCCLHCYSPQRSALCVVFIVMAVAHVRWCWCTRDDTLSAVTRIKLQAEGDSIQAWPQAVVPVVVVVARLNGRLVVYWLFLFWAIFGFVFFSSEMIFCIYPASAIA